MPDVTQRIIDNVNRVRGRIAEAARSSGRSPEAITLVAVTKYVGPREAKALVAAGCQDLGESRPQELWRKAEALAETASGRPIRWHMVGHLQRNKVARTLPLASMIHSVDSRRLLESLQEAAARTGRCQPILLEVNISAEPAKHGFAPQELEAVLADVPPLTHLQLRGLMTMAALEGGRERARRDFAALRDLRDRLRAVCPSEASLDELSMGMSEDFDVAIAEGATIVRVGSALFEGVPL